MFIVLLRDAVEGVFRAFVVLLGEAVEGTFRAMRKMIFVLLITRRKEGVGWL